MKKSLANSGASVISQKKKKKYIYIYIYICMCVYIYIYMMEQFMKSMSMFVYKISKVLQRAILEKENNT